MTDSQTPLTDALRAELAEVISSYDSAIAALQSASNERHRLRSALADIADAAYGTDTPKLRNRARIALNGDCRHD